MLLITRQCFIRKVDIYKTTKLIHTEVQNVRAFAAVKLPTQTGNEVANLNNFSNVRNQEIPFKSLIRHDQLQTYPNAIFSPQKVSSLNTWNFRNYCTKKDTTEATSTLSKKEQLKKIFKEYGSTIIIFHVAISLVSLGSCYLLISSGIDVIALLEKIGFAPEALKNSVAIGASNFIIAYAVHKMFAPVRISITLGSAPFIVRYLRSKGLLKPKNIKK